MSVRDVFERYVAVWSNHGEGGFELVRDELKALVADDVVYVDMPSGHTYEGRDSMARALAAASELYRATIDTVSIILDSKSFAIEYTCEMSYAGTAIRADGVAVGTIAADGKVTGHRDYYDASALFAAQASVPANP